MDFSKCVFINTSSEMKAVWKIILNTFPCVLGLEISWRDFCQVGP